MVEALEERRLLSASLSMTPLFEASASARASRVVSPQVASLTAAKQHHSPTRHHKPHRDASVTFVSAAPSPIARFESAGEVVNGKLFVFGGFVDSDVHATTRSDVYDPKTDTWRQIADMPEPLTHTGHVVVGSSIWFVGGFVGDEGMVISPSTSHVWIYNTKTNTWSAGPDLPAARGAGALVKLGNTLHFFGGLETRDQDQGEQWVLSLKRPTGWVADASMPIAVNHLAGVALNGKIYAIGGQHLWDEDSGNTAAVQVYDPASHAWSIAATLPAPRGHIADSTFVLNNKIVIVGGASNGVSALNDVICYMPGRRGWMTLGTFPDARRAPVARAVGGRLIVTTGDPGDVSATDQTWVSSRPAW